MLRREITERSTVEAVCLFVSVLIRRLSHYSRAFLITAGKWTPRPLRALVAGEWCVAPPASRRVQEFFRIELIRYSRPAAFVSPPENFPFLSAYGPHLLHVSRPVRVHTPNYIPVGLAVFARSQRTTVPNRQSHRYTQTMLRTTFSGAIARISHLTSHQRP